MIQHLRGYLAIAGTVLALVSVVCTSAGAQQKSETGPTSSDRAKMRLQPLPEGGPAPRLADGHPDLSGVWFPGLLGTENAEIRDTGAPENAAARAFDPKVTPEEKPSFQPWALEQIKQNNLNLDEKTLRTYGDGNQEGGAGNYPNLPKAEQIALLDLEIRKLSTICLPHGVPGLFLNGAHGTQLVESPGQLVQLTDVNHDYRVIPTDGRPHTKDPDPSFNGEGIGHWEGDTLIIDTIGIDDRIKNNNLGWFHSDQEHVIERITRPSLNYLIYQVTIEDPKVLTKPWTSAPHRYSLSRGPQLDEWYCAADAYSDENLQTLKKQRNRLEEEK
jgi:hypothetical protein